MYFCILCIVCFVSFSVLLVCICVLNYYHWVATQLQLNISVSYINIENAKYSVSRVQLYGELSVGASLSSYDLRPSCIIIS
jgi:hypothetical protein